MAFTHRKLISASQKLDISYCQSYCDPKTTQAFCPSTCFDWCPYTCNPATFSPPPPSPPTTNSSHNKILSLPLPLLIILSFLVAISFLLFCYTLYKSYKNWVDLMNRRRRRRPPEEAPPEETHDQFLDQDHGPLPDHPVWYIRTVGLQSSVISSIAICKYKRGDGLVEGTECSVCLNEFQEDETLRLLPKCNHAFHIPCIDTWLRSHTNCPLCRAGIVGNAPVALLEQSGGDRGAEEESLVVVDEGFGREREGGELVGIEEGERGEENWEKSLEAPEEDLVCQPERRSVSLDCVYASITSAYQGEIAGSSGKMNESIVDIVGGSSIGRSPQEGPISMKRSLSCSGKR